MNNNAAQLNQLAAAEKKQAEQLQATQPQAAQELMLKATSHATQAATLHRLLTTTTTLIALTIIMPTLLHALMAWR